MRLDYEFDGLVIAVTLSRRNLQALLAKLDDHPPNSTCAIIRPAGEGQPQLTVRAEEDDIHYERWYGPGVMHPDTETAIR